MIGIISIIFFVLGLIIGSFLNVVILRFNTQRTLGGRSACMSCQKKLSWYELVPVFSYFFQRGRCRGCQSKISRIYPVVELVTGLIFLGLFLKFQDLFFANSIFFTAGFAYFATMFSILVVIAFYDLRHKIIPDVLSFVFGTLAFIGLFFFDSSILHLHVPSLFQFFAGPLAAVPFATLWLLSRGTWMGLGDAKLLLGLGWLLGISMVFSGIVIAFWVGAVIGLMLIIFSRNHRMKSEIPFAPFLALGAVIAFLFELHLFG